VLINREIALKVGGYDPDFQVCEDIELFDRMLNYGYLITLQEELMNYRVHGSSLSMEKYLSQGLITRYVLERQRRRIDTGEELTYAHFLQNVKRKSLALRFRQRLADVTGLLYRRAGLAYSNKQYVQFCIYFGATTLLRPSFALRRVWQQVLSPRTRRVLRGQKVCAETGRV
jgi:hypothetical protein